MNKKLLFFSFILFFVLQAESNKKNNFSSIDFDSGKKDDLSLPSDNDDKYLSIYHLDDDSQLPLDSEKKLKKDVVKKNKNSRIFEKNEIDKDDSREKKNFSRESFSKKSSSAMPLLTAERGIQNTIDDERSEKSKKRVFKMPLLTAESDTKNTTMNDEKFKKTKKLPLLEDTPQLKSKKNSSSIKNVSSKQSNVISSSDSSNTVTSTSSTGSSSQSDSDTSPLTSSKTATPASPVASDPAPVSSSSSPSPSSSGSSNSAAPSPSAQPTGSSKTAASGPSEKKSSSHSSHKSAKSLIEEQQHLQNQWQHEMNEYDKALNQDYHSEKSKKTVDTSDNAQKQAAFIQKAEAEGISPEQAQEAAENFFPVSGS